MELVKCSFSLQLYHYVKREFYQVNIILYVMCAETTQVFICHLNRVPTEIGRIVIYYAGVYKVVFVYLGELSKQY